MRGLLIGVDPAASLALAALAGFLVAALIGWRVWAAANRRTAQALAAAVLADRELAASEATMHGLHERLDELRAALSVKAAELERMSRQREQAQHELTHLQAVHAEKLAGLDELRA